MELKKLLPLFFAVFFINSAIAKPPNINLNFIAQTSQPAPSENNNLLANFEPPHLADGYITFLAKDTVGQEMVLTNLHGHLSAVASQNTTVPNGNGTFTSFSSFGDFFNTPNSSNVSISAQKIAFVGTDHFWQSGIYTESEEDGLQLLVNLSTPIPKGQSTFASFAYPTVLADGSIAFWASGNNNQEGIYYANPHGQLHKLIDTNTSIPGGNGEFTHFAYPAFSHSSKDPESFAFVGEGNKKQKGIYLMRKGQLTKIADTNTNMPGGNVGYFNDFKEISYDANTNEVAFIGKGILGQKGIFVYNGKKIVPLVQPTDAIPKGIGQFTGFSFPNIENHYVLFEGSGGFKQDGLYLFGLNGDMFKIISNKDKINGKQVKSVAISAGAVSRNQVSALITFEDGSSGIYIITLVNLNQT